MKFTPDDLLLYAVTDRSWLGDHDLVDQVEETILAGTTIVQLREKELSDKDFLAEAVKIQSVCQKHNIPFIINDNLEVAIACGADGIHVGQSDLAANQVRERLGKDKIIGVSAQTVEQAILAEQMGADYLGVGAVFSTSTKLDASDVSFDTLKQICKAVSIPVVAIGGINAHNLLQLSGSGVNGVAVVSAIFAQNDISKATRELRQLAEKMVKA
ncbi:thiamine phosphate synthase [Clostridium facile]|uniref:Thiamine-phosphate synthase n=1 Tax=Clostridium facile TaxID=2763035 RepID=A0ABR7IRT9_9CLOT|nr:thiamine phosphate synthase [Clostridium facile]MBC5787851.1 thiamine phosphate synthase [Clostridium facile]